MCVCGRESRVGQRTCTVCHSTYMREWRKTHPMNEKQKMKDNCRSYAGVYLRRGKIKKEPCMKCGSLDSQMHHEDYSKPLDVMWLCRQCHMEVEYEKMAQ